MKLLRTAALALPVALLATAFAPATIGDCTTIDDPRSQDPAVTLELCESQAWFTSANQAKVDNLASVGASDFPTWDDSEPASVTTGSGAGFLGQYQTSLITGADATSGVTYVGQVDGALDAIAIEQHIFTASDVTSPTIWGEAGYGIVLTVEANGRTVYQSDFVEGDRAPIEASGRAVRVFRVAVTDLLVEAAAYEGTQDLTINITPYFFGDEGVFVYDAAEAPSNITFNPSDLTGFARLSANSR